jgi:predicted transcriptional regulator
LPNSIRLRPGALGTGLRTISNGPSFTHDAMIRRSKLEVFMDIMKVVAEEREMKRTRIMYKANLAWTVLNDALDSLEKKGILASKDTPSGVVVAPTPSGLDLLKRFREVESVFMEPTANAEGLIYPTHRMEILR